MTEPAGYFPANRKNGRSGEIRTPDPHNPIVVRYQAALRSDRRNRAAGLSLRIVPSAPKDVQDILEFGT